MSLLTLQIISIFSMIAFVSFAMPYMFQKFKEHEARALEKERAKSSEQIKRLQKQVNEQATELNRRKFTKKEFLTEHESAFLRMFVASPITRREFNIHPQVAMSAFLTAYNDKDRAEFNFRRVDFLVCDKYSKKIYCVIELDGKEHANKQMDDLERDQMLEAAGIKTIRIKNDAFPTPEQLKQRIISLQR